MLPHIKTGECKNVLAPDSFSARVGQALRRGHESHRILFWWPILTVAGFLLAAIFFDGPVIHALTNWPDHERAFFAFVTGFGKSDWILIPALLGMLVAWGMGYLPLTYSWRWAMRSLAGTCAFVFVGVALPGLIVVILKRIIGRARPMYMEDVGVLHFEPLQHLVDWSFHSFPSGHSTTALAFTIVLLTLTNDRFRGAIIAFGLAIGLSRIVVGDHFFTDVVSGILLGTVSAIVIRDYFATRNWGMRIENGKVHFRLFAGFLPLWRWLQRRHIPKMLK